MCAIDWAFLPQRGCRQKIKPLDDLLFPCALIDIRSGETNAGVRDEVQAVSRHAQTRRAARTICYLPRRVCDTGEFWLEGSRHMEFWALRVVSPPASAHTGVYTIGFLIGSVCGRKGVAVTGSFGWVVQDAIAEGYCFVNGGDQSFVYQSMAGHLISEGFFDYLPPGTLTTGDALWLRYNTDGGRSGIYVDKQPFAFGNMPRLPTDNHFIWSTPCSTSGDRWPVVSLVGNPDFQPIVTLL